MNKIILIVACCFSAGCLFIGSDDTFIPSIKTEKDNSVPPTENEEIIVPSYPDQNSSPDTGAPSVIISWGETNSEDGG